MMRRSTVFAAAMLALGFSTAAPAASPAWTQHIGPVVAPTEAWEQVEVQEPSVDFDAASHTFRMWYTGADEAKCMVGYATSSDGLTWSKPLDHPVIGWGYGGVKMNACHSNVQRLDGRYYAWFSIDSQAYGVTNGNLYEAVSSDGVNWAPLPKPALRAAKTGWNTLIANAFVVRDHGRWLMFWESFGNGLWRMSTATSRDLIRWTPAKTGPLRGLGFGDTFGGPWILRERTGWTMYLHAPAPHPAAGDAHMYSLIYAATSPDLARWRTLPDVLVKREQPAWQVDQIADPSVVEADGKRFMYFSGLDNEWPIRASIGVAVLG